MGDSAVLRIGVVGNHSQARENHRTTSATLGHVADVLGQELQVSWVPTIDLQPVAKVPRELAGRWRWNCSLASWPPWHTAPPRRRSATAATSGSIQRTAGSAKRRACK